MLTPDGLQPMHDVPLYGRIAVLRLYKPQGEKRQLLYIATERLMFCVLAYDQTTGSIVTRAMGDLTARIGRTCEHGLIGEVDPECRQVTQADVEKVIEAAPVGSKPQSPGAAGLLRKILAGEVSLTLPELKRKYGEDVTRDLIRRTMIHFRGMPDSEECGLHFGGSSQNAWRQFAFQYGLTWKSVRNG